MADFIDDKSAKAKGKRFTTLPLTTIEDITSEPEPEPEPEPEEPETEPETEAPTETPEAEPETEQQAVAETADKAVPEAKEGTLTTEVGGVKLTITNEIPEDSKPQDEQLSLF